MTVPKKILNKFFLILFRFSAYKFSLLRKMFWNISAKRVDNRWGRLKGDYDALESIIISITPNRILDIGCGSGRLFPLYQALGIKEVVGQDIAQSALDLARTR